MPTQPQANLVQQSLPANLNFARSAGLVFTTTVAAMPARALSTIGPGAFLTHPIAITNRIARQGLTLKALFQGASPPAVNENVRLTIRLNLRLLSGSIFTVLVPSDVAMPAGSNLVRSELLRDLAGDPFFFPPNTTTEGDWMNVEVFRDPSDPADTYGANWALAESLLADWTNVAL